MRRTTKILIALYILLALLVPLEEKVTDQSPAATTRVGAATLGTADCGAIPSRQTIYMATATPGEQMGTLSRPVTNFASAASRIKQLGWANPTIVIRGGIYREGEVEWQLPDTKIMNFPGEAVWFEGVAPIAGIQKNGDFWTGRLEKKFDPYTGTALANRTVEPPQPIADQAAGMVEQVWVDGEELKQVATLAEVTVASATFHVSRPTTGTPVVTLGKSGTEILGSKYRYLMSFRETADQASVCGIGIRRYSDKDFSAINFISADNVVIRDVVVTRNSMRGLSIFTEPSLVNTTGRYANNATVQNVTITYNGFLGLNTSFADGLRVLASKFKSNNTLGFAIGSAAAGAKIHSSRNVELSDSYFTGNNGNGLWFDLAVVNVKVLRNVFSGNERNGLFVELVSRSVIAGNIFTNNLAGLKVLESQDLEIWNNTFYNNTSSNIEILEGLRETGNEIYCDMRYGCPGLTDSTVHDLGIVNNILIGGVSTSFRLRDAHSTPKSLSDFKIRSTNNAYYRQTYSAPGRLGMLQGIDHCGIAKSVPSECPTLGSVGLESSSIELVGGTNLLAVNPATGDFNLPVSSLALTSGKGFSLPSIMPMTATELSVALGLPNSSPQRMGSTLGQVKESTMIYTSITR